MTICAFDGIAALIASFGARGESAPDEAVCVRQVHGRDVAICDGLTPADHRDVEADALIATRPGTIVAVKTADCVPVLLASRVNVRGARWAAAVHAGWRGAVAGVLDAAVQNAAAAGHRPSDLCAAVGPSIGACCYEVGEDVAAQFRRLGLPVFDGAKPRLDLAGSARELLVRAGLAAAAIEVCAPCTRCHPERYHSYRAAGASAGRQLSWIGWRA
jgi:YfiH family protein